MNDETEKFGPSPLPTVDQVKHRYPQLNVSSDQLTPFVPDKQSVPGLMDPKYIAEIEIAGQPKKVFIKEYAYPEYADVFEETKARYLGPDGNPFIPMFSLDEILKIANNAATATIEGKKRRFSQELVALAYLSERGFAPNLLGFAFLDNDEKAPIIVMDFVEGADENIPAEWVSIETVERIDTIATFLSKNNLFIEDLQFRVSGSGTLFLIDVQGLSTIPNQDDKKYNEYLRYLDKIVEVKKNLVSLARS